MSCASAASRHLRSGAGPSRPRPDPARRPLDDRASGLALSVSMCRTSSDARAGGLPGRDRPCETSWRPRSGPLHADRLGRQDVLVAADPRTRSPMIGNTVSARVLVAYATKLGSTGEIAETIAQVLRDGGHRALALPARDVREPRRLGRRDPWKRRLRRALAEGHPPVHRALPRGPEGPSPVAVQRRAPRSAPGQGRPADHPVRARRSPRGSARVPTGRSAAGWRQTRRSIPRSSRRTASATFETGRRSSSMRTGSAGSSTACSSRLPTGHGTGRHDGRRPGRAGPSDRSGTREATTRKGGLDDGCMIVAESLLTIQDGLPTPMVNLQA